MRLTICPDKSRLRTHLDGLLTVEEEAGVVSHLDACESCREILETLAAGGEPWLAVARGLGVEPPVPSPTWSEVTVGLEGGCEATNYADLDSLLTLLGLSEDGGSLGRLDHYSLRAVIGQGSMGLVFKGFDLKLERTVAIKVLLPYWALRPKARQRFLREARAAAAIRDQHVVAVHAVEECRGFPYLVMECISGGSLQDRLNCGEVMSLEDVVRIGREVALGLAAAHAHGLIHRDIKPANILLDGPARRVKITDFGLARAADDASLTQDGIVVGTPQFMSPEQARGEPVDHRADLFSLGAVLYNVCAGRAPFAEGGTLAILRRVSEERATPLREINPDVPVWLDEIITKLHAKEPADRFQSAAELADLLGEQMTHGQQRAHPPQPKVLAVSQRTRAPRHRRRWLTGAAVVLLSLGGLGMTEVAGVTRFTATVIRLLMPDGTLVLSVDDPDVNVTLEGEGGILINGIGGQQFRLRPGSYRWMATKEGKLLRTEVVTISRGGRQVISVHLEPPTTAVGEIRRFEGHIKNAYALAVSIDGARFVTGSWDETVRIWDVARGKELRCFNLRDENRRVNHAVYCVAVSPDGRLVLAGTRDGTVWLWDWESGEERWRHPVPVNQTIGATGVAFSPDGRHVLVSGGDGLARLWQISPWQETQRLNHSQSQVCWSVCVSTDGRQALTAGGPDLAEKGGGIALWDLQTGAMLRRFKGHEQGIWCAVFSPDSRFVLSGSNDATLRLWDAGSAKELRCFKGHTQGVRGVAFSPDCRRALSASMDHTVRVWDLHTGEELHRFVEREFPGEIVTVAFVPPGRQALSGTFQGTIRQWQLPP